MFSNYNSKRAKAFRTAPLFWGTDHLEVVWDHFHSSVIILLRAFLGTNHLDLVWDHFHSSKSIFGDRPLETSVGSFSQQCFNSIIVVTELEPSGV